MKLGLKVWSTNTDAYLHEARRLYAEGVYDYVELYAVPGSLVDARISIETKRNSATDLNDFGAILFR